MIYPTIGSLLEKVDSRFMLVSVVAKRAKQLINGAHKLTKCNSEKPVTIATNEVNENMISFIRQKTVLNI
jgi:DNA-directed RNA polymerase subunit omega